MSRTKQITIALGLAAALTGVAARLTAEQSAQVVQVRDDCDPATFNAAIGDGTCIGDGDTTFADFLAEVTAKQSAEQWRFNPDRMSEPRRIVAQNRGGETHTFTRVAAFGGGVVGLLNDLSGNPDPAPECKDGAKFGASVVPPGASLPVNSVAGGDKFQCCIHPWMRTTVRNR
jgi:hypothetical protein